MSTLRDISLRDRTGQRGKVTQVRPRHSCYVLDDWDVEPVVKADNNKEVSRPGHEISDDFDREMSVIEKVLAAAAARRRKEQSKTGHESDAHEVSTKYNKHPTSLLQTMLLV